MKADQYQHTSDAELLDKFAADGNAEWLGILLQRYTLLLLGVCLKYLKDETEARDAVQQVFLKVLTEVPKYKIEYFKSWLYMVAKNHCLMRLRSKDARWVREVSEDTPTPEESTREEILENEAAYDVLEDSLAELSKEQQTCVQMFYLQKQSYQQIGEQTGFSLLQVKSYIQNGKRNLKLIMERKLKQKGMKK